MNKKDVLPAELELEWERRFAELPEQCEQAEATHAVFVHLEFWVDSSFYYYRSSSDAKKVYDHYIWGRENDLDECGRWRRKDSDSFIGNVQLFSLLEQSLLPT